MAITRQIKVKTATGDFNTLDIGAKAENIIVTENNNTPKKLTEVLTELKDSILGVEWEDL